MDRYRKPGADAHDSPASEVWLFAQEILGQRTADADAAARRAREERERFEWLGKIAPRRAAELREVDSAESRRRRESLVWTAGIFTGAEATLREQLRREADQRQAQDQAEEDGEPFLGSNHRMESQPTSATQGNSRRRPMGPSRRWGKRGSSGGLRRPDRRRRGSHRARPV